MRWSPRLLDWGPWIVTGLFAALIALPDTRNFALGLQKENQPIEWLTVLLLLLGAGAAMTCAARPGPIRERFVFGLGAALFFFVAGEELAWGQYLLGGPISESWAAANRQGETTLHNMGALQGKAELMYLLPAVCALVAMRGRCSHWLGRAAPSRRLAPALILVALFSIVEFASTWFPAGRPLWDSLYAGIRPLGEMIELVIGWIVCRYALEGARATEPKLLARDVDGAPPNVRSAHRA